MLFWTLYTSILAVAIFALWLIHLKTGGSAVERCPGCKRRNSMCLTTVLQVVKPGTYSIAGSQTKVAAEEKAKLYCDRCGWSAMGRVEDNYFVAE